MAPRRDRGVEGRASACSASRGRPFSDISRAFYSRVTFGHGEPITSTVRGSRSIGPGEHLPHFGHSSWWTPSI
ncbi:hypothetical protein AAG906_017192 [Vitis piasezkii]